MQKFLGIPKRTWGVLMPLLIFAGLLGYLRFRPLPSANSYQECLNLPGSLLRESYPAVCVTRSGQEFIQPIPTQTPDNDQVNPVLEPTPLLIPTPMPVNPLTNWRQFTIKQDNLILEVPPNWTIDTFTANTDPLVLISSRSGELVIGIAVSRTDQNLPADFTEEDITGPFAFAGWTGNRAQVTRGSGTINLISVTKTISGVEYQSSFIQSGGPTATTQYFQPFLASVTSAIPTSTSPTATSSAEPFSQ